MKAQRGSRGIAPFLNLSARREQMVNGMPWLLHAWERPVTHCTGGWVGLRAGWEGCRKSHPPLGFDPQTIQPVASCYTD